MPADGGENEDVSFKELVKQATLASQIPQQNFGMSQTVYFNFEYKCTHDVHDFESESSLFSV